MADPKTTQQQIPVQRQKVLTRCGERVTEARLSSALHVFAGRNVLVTQAGKDGNRVQGMALHPAGLAVQHLDGRKVVIPMVHVEYAVVAEDEG